MFFITIRLFCIPCIHNNVERLQSSCWSGYILNANMAYL